MSLLADVRATTHYLSGLCAFWRTPYDARQAADTIRTWLAQRQEAFLDMMRERIYAVPGSPYLRLLEAAGFTLEDVERLAGQVGVEGCARRLLEAGVFVTLDEFKGRRPIERLGLSLPVTMADFAAPTGASELSWRSGGSRSQGTPIPVSVLDKLTALPPCSLHAEVHGLQGRPWAEWWPAPPGTAGAGRAMRYVKVGQPLLRWFSPTPPGPGRAAGRSTAITWGTVLASAMLGQRIPYPRYVPMQRAEVIARWLAGQRTRGVLVTFDTMASGAVRIALSAEQLGLDISGHIMRTGGEPLTPGKVAVLERAGLRYCSQYGSSEAETMGFSCGDGQAPDDMHLLTYRLAMVQLAKRLEGWPEPVGALLITRFSPRAALVMLNLELGDYGVLIERDCDCALGAAGLRTHLHTIRSYEKLTSVGMHFMGADLHEILEESLPGRFGGGPLDYQFVERELDGQTTLTLVMSPAVGPANEGEVIAYTLGELERRTKAGRMMTDIWRDAGLLRLERAEPRLTRAAKIQPLHVERKV